MDKSQLISKLKTLPFDKNEYWLAAGGAMVLYGFREQTGDVDLGCSKKLADLLEKQGRETAVLKDGSRKIIYDDDVEIFENWLKDKTVMFDGFPVVSVDGLIAMKKELGREKDYKDIEIIEKHYKIMSKKTSKEELL